MQLHSVLFNKIVTALRISIVALLVAFASSLAISPAYAFHFPWDQGHDTTDPNDADDPGTCEEGDCDNDPCNKGSKGSPVNLATGYFVWSETDIVLKGRPRLAVTRTFNSHDPRVGLVGNGWSMSCDRGLIFTSRFITNQVGDSELVREFVRRLPNGKRYIYSERPDGKFAAPGLFDVIERLPDNMARLERRNGSYSIYGETGELLATGDRNSNIVNYIYDTQGRLIQKADTNGRSLTYEYNANGLVSIIRDHTGREWLYGYDADANLTLVTDPLNGARTYGYETYQAPSDGQSYTHLNRITDETGVVETDVTYSGARVSSYTDLANTYSYQYDKANRRATKTDSMGSQWVYTYNTTGQFTRIDAPLGRTFQYERDADSLITTYTDPSGTAYSYTYDAFGNRLSQSDSRGTITITYDNEKPWPLTINSRSGRVTTLTYNAQGNPLTVTDSDGNISNLSWSPQGDLLQITNALNNQTTNTYNIQGMPLTVTDPLGRATQYQYDSLNNLVSMTNPVGEVMQYQYDALDRVISYTDGNGDTTSYSYDAADRITQVNAPNNQTAQYTYDNFGRLSQRTFYDGTNHTYQFRIDNLVSQMTRPDNVVSSMVYDDAKRLIQRTIGTEDTYQYAYNLRDQLTTASNITGTVTFAYDAFGRKTNETVNGQATTYQYNTEDEIEQLTSMGLLQTQQFDVRGLLSQLDISGSSYQYSYDAITRLTSINRTNAINTTMQYDEADQLLQISHAAGLRSYQYQYDLASRVNQWQGVANETRSYNYDPASRLTNVQSIINPESFNYDSIGNRLNNNAQYDNANRIIEDDNFIYSYDVNGNQTQKLNKSTGVVEQYSYNSLDQLVQYQFFSDSNPATSATVDFSYTYGPFGRRWAKQDNLGGGSRQFYWSDTSMIGELSGSIQRRYIMEGKTPIGFVENGQVYHYFKDHLGAAHEASDSNGTVVWRGSYDSFGKVTETITTADNYLRFPGQYHDEESGLYYNYFRFYDPSTGRYITSDPIGIIGLLNGAADRIAMNPTIPPNFTALQGGLPYQTISRSKPLNTYTYAANSPLLNSDPLGLDAAATLGRGLAIWGGASVSDGPFPAGEIVGGVIFIGFAGVALYEYCTDDEEAEDKNCEALYQSILATCAGLTGKKKFRCFEAARIARDQCYQER